MYKEKYFYIEPYVYSILINNHLLLYNTFNSECLTFNLKNTSLINFIKETFGNEKNRLIKLESQNLKDKSILNFINICRASYFGDVIETNEKPLVLTPIPKLNKDYREYNTEIKPSIYENDIKYSIKNFFLFINTKHTNCTNTQLKNTGYKQILFPYFFAKNKSISFEEVMQFFSNYDLSKLESVIVLGNIFKDKVYNKYINFFGNILVFYVYYKDFDISDAVFLKIITEINNPVILWVDKPIDTKILISLLKINLNLKFKFVIEDIDFYHNILELIENDFFNDTVYEFVPFYNKNNLSFFKENIYNTKKDILSQKLDERAIFSRMYINHLNYGKLFILPNGKIYSNLYSNKIGDIQKDKLNDILKNIWFYNNTEMWFKTRNDVSPCTACIYKFICPPISNYEQEINQMNLCKYNIKLNKWE